MKFTCNTKPLKDALSLGVIKSNVSKFYQKSTLAKLTVDQRNLKINLEAAYIVSQLNLTGSGDEDKTYTIFVDCVTLSDLVNTFDEKQDSVTTIEFVDGGITIHSGKSKFNLPQLVEGEDLDLMTPSPLDNTTNMITLNKADWKFVDDYQMYALAMSFIHPVYTRAWLGGDRDIIIGDYDEGIFTHSKKNNLGGPCLFSNTIINLFNILPEGSKLAKLEKTFEVNLKTDAFEYIAEFTPQHEEDEGVGSYHSEMILPMMTVEPTESAKVNITLISKFLSQSTLLSGQADDIMTITLGKDQIKFKDPNIDCTLPVEGNLGDHVMKFKTAILRLVISHLDEEIVTITPSMQDDGTLSGLLFKTANMESVISLVEE